MFTGFYRIILLAFLVGLMLSCARQNPVVHLESPSSELVSTTTDFPAVVKVVTPGGRALCTGTFVTPRLVLTAAHCTQDNGRYWIISSFGTFSTYQVQRFGPGVVDDPNDMAALLLSKDEADPRLGRVIPLGREVYAGDKVRLVGFGCDDLDKRLGAGVKRTGTNQVADVGDYIELVTPSYNNGNDRVTRNVLGPSNRAGSCFGDSGGPLLSNQGNGWEVVGLSHSGGWSDGLIISHYIRLSRSDNQQLLQQFDDMNDLGIFDSCWRDNAGADCRFNEASAEIVKFLRWLVKSVISFFSRI